MFEIHVTVSCPDILAAAQLLSKGTVPTAAAAPAPVAASTVAAPEVPLAQAPTYTLQQICKAGADLVTQNPGMLSRVNALLAQYGVQAVTDLKPEHFGAVATALRGLGAQI